MQVLDHRRRRAAGEPTDRMERQHQMRRARKPALEVRGEAVRRDDVEADAREQHHARGARFRIARGELLEDVDLAGDVEVVDPGAQARVGHRPERADERAGTVEDDRHALQAVVDRTGIVKSEGPMIEPELRWLYERARPASTGRWPRRAASRAISSPVYPLAP